MDAQTSWGDTHATADEFAWLDVSYTTLKLGGFLAAAWAMDRLGPRKLMIVSTLTMGASCALAVITTRLEFLVALRALQGASGGVLLVTGQTILFLSFTRNRQPLVQAAFATTAVVAAATIAPAMQGWLLDRQSWTWIFFGVVPVALASVSLLVLAEREIPVPPVRRKADLRGFILLSVAIFCATYVLSQGSRWDWFEAPHIAWLTAIGT